MDAARTEPALRDLKAPALAEHNVAGGKPVRSSPAAPGRASAARTSKPNTGRHLCRNQIIALGIASAQDFAVLLLMACALDRSCP